MNTAPPHKPRIKFHRSIFISDLHMGHKGFDAQACLDFLKHNDAEYLYLVGDIIDGWKLKKRWHWTRDCSLIIDELVKKAKSGTKITYITGNHDDKIRRLNIFQQIKYLPKMKLRIKNLCIHKTAAHKKFIVMHGDQFDSAIVRGKLSEWGDWLYMYCTEWGLLTPKPQRIVLNGKDAKFSLAKSISRASKKVGLSLMNNLERSIFRLIKHRNVDGLICGHTHIATIKDTSKGIYCNTGCWSGDRNTALIEDYNGKMSLIKIADMRHKTFSPSYYTRQEPYDLHGHLPQTQRIVHHIYKMWRPNNTIDFEKIVHFKQKYSFTLKSPIFNDVAAPLS